MQPEIGGICIVVFIKVDVGQAVDYDMAEQTGFLPGALSATCPRYLIHFYCPLCPGRPPSNSSPKSSSTERPTASFLLCLFPRFSKRYTKPPSKHESCDFLSRSTSPSTISSQVATSHLTSSTSSRTSTAMANSLPVSSQHPDEMSGAQQSSNSNDGMLAATINKPASNNEAASPQQTDLMAGSHYLNPINMTTETDVERSPSHQSSTMANSQYSNTNNMRTYTGAEQSSSHDMMRGVAGNNASSSRPVAMMETASYSTSGNGLSPAVNCKSFLTTHPP